MASDVHSEYDSLASLCKVPDCNLLTGDLTVAESRLMLRVKGVRGIVYVASHEMDPLWCDDGIGYHTLIISPAVEPRKTLARQLHAACTFLSSHAPALVCSPCPKLRAAVAVAMRLHQGATDVSETIEGIRRCAGATM